MPSRRVRQRHPSPEGERRTKRLCRGGGALGSRLVDELLEALQVELALFDAKEVAARRGWRSGPRRASLRSACTATWSELAAFSGNVAPESVDEALAKDYLVGVEEENREQCALTAPAYGEGTAVLLDLERAEQLELDACPASLLHHAKRAVSDS